MLPHLRAEPLPEELDPARRDAGNRPRVLLDILDVEEILSTSLSVTKSGETPCSVDGICKQPGPKLPS